MEPLGGGTLLEEVCYWREDWSHFLSSLCFMTTGWSLAPTSAIMASCHDELGPFVAQQEQLFLSLATFSRIFITAAENKLIPSPTSCLPSQMF